MTLSKYESFIPFVLFSFSVILILLTSHNPFYWDNTVQISVPANWYYQTNFKFFFLPDNIATGHPTFVGMYFAFLWKIFGRSLIVCHLGMFPFVFGLLLQINYFLKNIKAGDFLNVLIIMAFVIADATFLSQLSLITFDVIQLFFFFLCINLMLTSRQKLFAFCYMVLVLVSLRGSIMAGGVLIFNLLYDHYTPDRKLKIRAYIKYLPGILSLFLFLLLFKLNKGWVIHNTVSKEWPSSGELASFKGMIWNTFIFTWRLIDYGRIGLFIFFIIFIFKSIIIRKIQDNTLRILLFIITGQFILFFPILVASKIPFGHRYLLPVIIPAIILTVYWVRRYSRHALFFLPVIFAVLLSGHFWLYPLKVSQGWDSTTLHWKYFRVSGQMDTYINEQKINKKEIGTFFPDRQSRYFTYIGADTNDVYSGIPFYSRYILYSNAFNVNPEVIDSLYSAKSNWELVKKYSEKRIFIGLYSKKK